MSKKIYLIILVLIIVLQSTGCRPYDEHIYQKNNPEIFTIGGYSILGDTGERGTQIEIIDEDTYGRKMAHYKIYEINAVIVCQKVEGEYVYFYSDFNFILRPEGEEFLEGEIAAIKEKNDWGEKLDERKMIRAKITTKKERDFGKEWRTHMFEEDGMIYGTIRDGENTFFINLGRDKDHRTLFEVKVSIYQKGRNQYLRKYALILNPDNSVQESYLMLIEDDYNYQKQLKEFKELNDWELYAE